MLAHRGNSAEVPENTREAFEDAARMTGADVIETDTYLTKDGQFVFFHDPVLQRTTNGRGAIHKRTLAELKELDAGYNFEDNQGNHPFRGKGFKIQSVDEILPAFKNHRFNIDIKSRDPRAPALFAKKLVDLGIEEGSESRVMVASFWQKQIARFREASRIPTSASTMEVIEFRKVANRWAKRHRHCTANSGKITAMQCMQRPVARQCERHCIELGRTVMQEELFGRKLSYAALQIPEKFWILTVIGGKWFIDFAHALGIAVHIWTINEPADMERLLDWGVDGIFSDAPAVLIDVLDRREKKARN